jgi:hypothetical protein
VNSYSSFKDFLRASPSCSYLSDFFPPSDLSTPSSVSSKVFHYCVVPQCNCVLTASLCRPQLCPFCLRGKDVAQAGLGQAQAEPRSRWLMQGTVLSHMGQEWEGECSVVDGSVLQFGQFSEVLWNSDGCHDSSCDSHHHTGVSSFTCHLPNKPPVPKSSLWAPPWKERLCHIFFSMTTWVGSRSVVICKRNFPTGLYSWSGDPSSTPFQLETLEKPVPESQFPQMANCTCSD